MRILLLVAIGLIISIALYALLDFARDLVFETAIPRRRGGSPPLWTPFQGLGRLRFLNQFLVYMAIMETRFQGRLRVEHTISDEAQEALVPNLVLQPLVENALEHGAARATGDGRIEIGAKRDGARLLLRVHDNGPGPNAGDGSGGGLTNTQARLAQRYGEAAAVTLTRARAR